MENANGIKTPQTQLAKKWYQHKGLITIFILAILTILVSLIASNHKEAWVSYANSEYGFSVMYPSNYGIETATATTDTDFQVYIGERVNSPKNSLSNGNVIVPHSFFMPTHNWNLLNHLQQLGDQNAPSQKINPGDGSPDVMYMGKVIVDGRTGYQTLSDSGFFTEKLTVIPNSDGSVFTFEAALWDREKNDISAPAPLEPYDSILKTIKFTSPGNNLSFQQRKSPNPIRFDSPLAGSYFKVGDTIPVKISLVGYSSSRLSIYSGGNGCFAPAKYISANDKPPYIFDLPISEDKSMIGERCVGPLKILVDGSVAGEPIQKTEMTVNISQ